MSTEILQRPRRSPEEMIRLLQQELAETNREVMALTVELERRVEERTRALQDAQQQLENKNARLEAANKELEAFSYSVSHDLRAPLRHLSGFAQALEADCLSELNETGRSYVASIIKVTHEMAGLLEALLQFSRSAQKELQQTRIDFSELVREVITGLGTEPERARIEWVVHPLPRVRGDLVLLRQVWTNLIGNAFKYTRRKEQARIEIGCRETSPREYVFFVRDNGAGFDMAQYERLFGIFQRLHHRSEFEGTGVGLAIVRRIVERHHGSTWAEAEPDQGATFYFSLPKEA